MPKDSDLADMDATIESLKLQIADSKDQIKQLTTSPPLPFSLPSREWVFISRTNRSRQYCPHCRTRIPHFPHRQ